MLLEGRTDKMPGRRNQPGNRETVEPRADQAGSMRDKKCT